ncbi:MAG: hypothetical protein ACMUIE_10825 [Thermoplasmatota archaeon]
MDKKYWEEFVKLGTEREMEERVYEDIGIKRESELDPSYYNDKKEIKCIVERFDWKLVLVNVIPLTLLFFPFAYFILFKGDVDFRDFNETMGYFIFTNVTFFLLLLGFFAIIWKGSRKTYRLIEGGIMVISGRISGHDKGKNSISRTFFVFDIYAVKKVILLSIFGGVRKQFLRGGELASSRTMRQYYVVLRPHACVLPPYTYRDELTGKMGRKFGSTYYDLHSHRFTVPRYVLKEFLKDAPLDINLP